MFIQNYVFPELSMECCYSGVLVRYLGEIIWSSNAQGFPWDYEKDKEFSQEDFTEYLRNLLDAYQNYLVEALSYRTDKK